MDSFNEAWALICEYCKQHVTEVAYKSWLQNIEPLKFDLTDGKIILMVKSDFQRNILMTIYMKLLKEAAKNVFGADLDIAIIVPEEINNETTRKNETTVDEDYEFTFDTFIVGSSNKFAHAASLAVATYTETPDSEKPTFSMQ